jgi:molybdate transport system regulatory protein
MLRSQPRQRKKAAVCVPRVKIWLEIDGRYAFGFGISEILQAIDRAGSIKQAARNLGKSYRYVWGRIKEAEDAVGRPLVDARVGGKDSRRSSLTPTARQLVNEFLAIRKRMIEMVDQEFQHRFRWPLGDDA